MVRLEDLVKVFETPNGAATAVNKVSLEVPEGEICILLGPSGCGKTTTLKMINRVISPTSGKIFINGEDTSLLDPVELRRNIGYVIQQIGLFPNMTIEENISIVPKLLGWDPKEYKNRAKELLDMVALDPSTFLHRFPRELSGGQQQRIGVIRALAADPPVMLMDEPFGAIDPINREVIQDEFLKMQKTLKKTILFVSHDIDEAIKMADKIAIFKDGKLVQFDAPDQLLAQPKNDFVNSFLGDDRALKRLRLVNAKQVMIEEPVAVKHTDSLKTALERIEAHGYLHAIVMVNDQHQPVGYVSKEKAKTTNGLCGEHYHGLKTVVNANDNLNKVASEMYTHDTTWIPCVDDNGRMLGQVTQSGITRYLSSSYNRDSSSIILPSSATGQNFDTSMFRDESK
ncbi:ABC transporter ATP-binding protein [Marinomonas sp. 5E14-1]|uniref:ABC transporter ATP-binding protein n=1 Tax=Marinomonas sp. 5E14-1 TaxID=3153922 RepID=UPI0032657E26